MTFKALFYVCISISMKKCLYIYRKIYIRMYVWKIMPCISTIPNKTSITLSIDAVKRDFCKEKRINISLLLDAALERETNPEAEEGFNEGLKRQNKNLRDFMEKTGATEGYYDYIAGGNADVVEKTPKQTNQSALGVFEDI